MCVVVNLFYLPGFWARTTFLIIPEIMSLNLSLVPGTHQPSRSSQTCSSPLFWSTTCLILETDSCTETIALFTCILNLWCMFALVSLLLNQFDIFSVIRLFFIICISNLNKDNLGQIVKWGRQQYIYICSNEKTTKLMKYCFIGIHDCRCYICNFIQYFK